MNEQKYIELNGLLAQFAEKKVPYEQINYFFDTKDQLLDQKGITLRLRHKRGTWQLKAKLKQKTANASYTANQELNEMISEEKAKVYLENGLDLFENVLKEMMMLTGIEQPIELTLLGSLMTERTDFAFYEDTISLDRNEYNGQVDFELERESTHHTFIQFINQRILHVEFNNGSGKRKRFLKTLPI